MKATMNSQILQLVASALVLATLSAAAAIRYVNVIGARALPGEWPSGVTAIAAGDEHSVVLRIDGSVLAWGRTGFYDAGQTTEPVAAQRGVIAIAGQTDVPLEARSGVAAISAKGDSTVALKRDGSVVVWGGNAPAPTGLGGLTAIAAGYAHTVALKEDGAVVAWGAGSKNTGVQPDFGQSLVPPAAQRDVTAIAAGWYHTVALVGTVPRPRSLNARPSGNELILTWPTNAVGSRLQTSFTLTRPLLWRDSTVPAAVIGAQFYRLIKQ